MTIDEIEALISNHGSITAQPLMDLVVMVVSEAVEAEREACALPCEGIAADDQSEDSAAQDCAAAIRARGER